MEIVIDIGNSNVVIGIYTEAKSVDLIRLKTINDREAKLYYDLRIREELLDLNLVIENIQGIYLSSVVPDLTKSISVVIASIFDKKVNVVNPMAFKKLKLSIDNPSEIGIDLVANAIAAVTRFSKACVIVDFGTALTFTTVTESFEILGVAIAPGLKTSMSALHNETAQLPEVPLILPSTVIGKNTTHAIQSGVLWGYVGLVKEMLLRINEETGYKFLPIATGGLSSILSPVADLFHDIDINLTLDGIRIMGRNIDKN